MANIKILAGQAAIYGVSTILGRLLNYLLVPLHTYMFENPAQYGIVTVLYAWTSLFMVLLTYGMETAFFRYSQIDKYKERTFSTLVISLFTTSLLFILLGTGFSQNIAGWLQSSAHSEYVIRSEYVIWLSIIIAIDAFSSIFFASLRQRMKAMKFAIIKITNISTSIFFNLFFLILCPYLLQKDIGVDFVNTIYNPEIGVGYIFISNLIASIVTLVLLLPELWKIKLIFDIKLWKIMFIYAFPLLIFNLAGIVNETIDRVLLERLSPPDIAQMQVGIYGACYKISIIITIFVQAFKYAAEPFFFNKAKDEDAKQTYSDVMSIFVLVCSFVFLSVMLYLDVVQYFVGPNYRVGLSIVPILLLANIFLGIFYNLSIWYKLTDKTKYGAYISLIGASITLLLNMILIPRIGYMGSAWATFVCYLSMVIISYLLGRRHYQVEYKVLKIIYYILLAVAIYLFSTFFSFGNFAFKMIIHTLLLLAYIAGIFMMDRHYLKMILKR